MILDYAEEEIISREYVINHYQVYLRKHVLLDERGLNDSRVNTDFLKTILFENYILSRKGVLSNILNGGEATKVEKTIDEIINLTANKDKRTTNKI